MEGAVTQGHGQIDEQESKIFNQIKLKLFVPNLLQLNLEVQCSDM